MLLTAIQKKPIEALDYLERYVNDGSPSGFTWRYQTSSRTSPRSDVEFFYLKKCYPVILNTIITLGEFPNLKADNQKNIDYILIHPDMEDIRRQEGCIVEDSNVRVMPTSSSRTVKLIDYYGYLKLNYNGIIGRIDRRLTKKHAQCSIELTRILTDIVVNNSSFSQLSFFRESGARVIVDEETNLDSGIVFRECQPIGRNSEKTESIIPMFSLVSKDQKYNSDDYLLCQLIDGNNKAPIDYVLENIFYPIIDNYFNLILTVGLQPEWHGQNILIGLDENLQLSALVIRDLESIDIDYPIRESMNLKVDYNFYPYKYIKSDQYNYQIKHSFMYDYKIGEYIFTPIISLLSDRYGLDHIMIQSEIKRYSRQYIAQLPENFFPEDGCWYSFKNIVVDRSVAARPYIQNRELKYR